MGLYLCIFDDDEDDIAGFDVGHYSDFGAFRDAIAKHIPDATTRFPTLMQHSDSDGEWTLDEIPVLKRELAEIATAFMSLPPEEPVNAFEHVAHCREGAESLYDCFHNVDEENLIEALDELCDTAMEMEKPISFQ